MLRLGLVGGRTRGGDCCLRLGDGPGLACELIGELRTGVVTPPWRPMGVRVGPALSSWRGRQSFSCVHSLFVIVVGIPMYCTICPMYHVLQQ